jgi:hypothetical protein
MLRCCSRVFGGAFTTLGAGSELSLVRGMTRATAPVAEEVRAAPGGRRISGHVRQTVK